MTEPQLENPMSETKLIEALKSILHSHATAIREKTGQVASLFVRFEVAKSGREEFYVSASAGDLCATDRETEHGSTPSEATAKLLARVPDAQARRAKVVDKILKDAAEVGLILVDPDAEPREIPAMVDMGEPVA